MKKRLLCFILVFSLIFPCTAMLAGCKKKNEKTSQEQVEEVLSKSYANLSRDGSYTQTFSSRSGDSAQEKAHNGYKNIGIAKVSTTISGETQLNKIEYSSGHSSRNEFEVYKKDNTDYIERVYSEYNKNYKLSKKTELEKSMNAFNQNRADVNFVVVISSLKQTLINSNNDAVWNYGIYYEDGHAIATIECMYENNTEKHTYRFKLKNNKLLNYSKTTQTFGETASMFTFNSNITYGTTSVSFDASSYNNEEWSQDALSAIDSIVGVVKRNQELNGVPTQHATYQKYSGSVIDEVKSVKYSEVEQFAKLAVIDSDSSAVNKPIIDYREYAKGEFNVVAQHYNVSRKIYTSKTLSKDSYLKELASFGLSNYAVELFVELIDDSNFENVTERDIIVSNLGAGAHRYKLTAKLHGVENITNGTALAYQLDVKDGKITSFMLYIDNLLVSRADYVYSDVFIDFDKSGYEKI